jgi:hypothetical protein
MKDLALLMFKGVASIATIGAIFYVVGLLLGV